MSIASNVEDYESESDEGYEGDESYEGFESDEGDDEGFESDDEGFESDDEGFESAESDESDDEGYESDESDESYERVVDEAVRQRRPQDRRQRIQARRMAADQRATAKDAAVTQQSISRTLGGIRAARPVQVRHAGRLEGNGVLLAELPNGRKTKMRLTPAPASIQDVNKLTSRIMANDRRQAAAEAANSRAITKLKLAQEAAVKKLSAQHVKSHAKLVKSIAAGDAALRKRITDELSGKKGFGAQSRKALTSAMEGQRRGELMNSLLLAVAFPFFAAYHEKGNPFSATNMKLTVPLVGFLMADEIIDALGGKGKSRWPRSVSNAMAYGAPIAYAALVYVLLDKNQHERFLIGKAPVAETGTGTVDLTTLVGANFKEEFKGRTDVVALATPAGTTTGVTHVTASVSSGILTLTATSSGTSVRAFDAVYIVEVLKPAS